MTKYLHGVHRTEEMIACVSCSSSVWRLIEFQSTHAEAWRKFAWVSHVTLWHVVHQALTLCITLCLEKFCIFVFSTCMRLWPNVSTNAYVGMSGGERWQLPHTRGMISKSAN